MTKNELLALLAELKDEDVIDDKLPKQTQPQKQEVTLDFLKSQLTENKEFAGYVAAQKDSAVSKGINTWKENNLEKIIKEEIEKINNKELTPDQKRIAELEKKLAEREEAERLLNAKNKYIETLNGAKLPVGLVDYIFDGDEKNAEERVKGLNNVLSEYVNNTIKDRVKENSYTPPTGNPDGAKEKQRVDQMRDRFKNI